MNWKLIYNLLHLLLFGSHNFKLITHVGYTWHLSVMNICLLKLQIRCVFESDFSRVFFIIIITISISSMLYG
jgi:hypothetical protein